MNTKEMEEFINRVRSIYDDWDLKLMVLLTLALQIMLMFLGARRKFTSKLWVRAIVWSAYISADSIAVLALGILSNKLGIRNTDNNNNSNDVLSLDDNTRLLALWSPCLLLLLGGPDSITAYSLEDNELWLRHLVGLVVQTAAAAYIYFLSWSPSYLSLLSILMFGAAQIKYGERVWVLWQASSGRLKDSMLDKADPSPNYPRFMDKYTLKKLEGYHVTADEVFEVQVQPPDLKDPAPIHSIMISDADELVMAYRFFQIFKRLFVDLILSSDDRDAIKSIFKGGGLTRQKAFKVIEIEIGFMYDLLHTKAIVLFTYWGVYRRIITSVISCIVLGLFAISHKPHYPKLDLAATFLLLSAIIFIEIYSVIMLLASDWVGVWMCTDVIISKFIRYVVAFVQERLRQPRWSNCVGQLSFFSFSVKAKPLPCYRALKLLSLHKKLDKLYYTSQKQIIDYIKQEIWIGIPSDPYKNFADHNGLLSGVLYGEAQVYGRRDSIILEEATKYEFDQAILVWHIATELCYYSYKHRDILSQLPPDMEAPRKSAKLLSRYLYYLLERYPFMLPNGIGQIRIRDTLAEALKFFQERGLFTDDQKEEQNRSSCPCKWLGRFCFCSCSKKINKKKRRQELRKLAHKMLLEVNTEVPPNKVKGGQSKSVLFDACILAKELIDIVGHNNKWLLIVRSLLALMYSAAYRCRGDIHARQLRRGGELMSHVWMMMAHFGLTDHFQMTQGHAIAKLVLN